MTYVFADYELDEALFQLRRGGSVVKVEPKTFDLLAYLLRHRDRVVTKEELLDAVWPRQAISESVLPKCVAAARGAVGDGRGRRNVIATIHGRGYRLVAPVEERVTIAGVGGTPSHPRDGAVAAPGRQTPFVGRAQAMQQLLAALAGATAGRGGTVLLAGEPGIGKTRLAEAFAGGARREGALVLVGRAYEGEGAPAFWPWLQILRACTAATDPAVVARDVEAAGAELLALLPELRRHLAVARPEPSIEGAPARFRLFDGVTTFLRRAAARRPLVLVFDDLHWADEASLRLLGFLAAEIAEARLLVVATYRDLESGRSHPLGELLAALAREHGCARVSLRGFEPAETASLIEAIAGRPIAAQTAAAVQEMTEGNPFFVQEITRLLVDEDRLVDAGAALVLPQSVRDAIGRRLATLSVACNAVLRAAAVVGREFDVALVARVAERPVAEVLEHLGDALAAGLVDRVAGGAGRHGFHHALIRQTLYEALRPPERIALHRRAGEALENACGADRDACLDELAHHFFEAAPGGDVAGAVDACARAAARAFRQLGYEQSARHYEHALEALRLEMPGDEGRRCALLLALGEARAAAGARDAARAAFERAAEVARALGRVDLLAAAALGYRGAGEMGSPAEAGTLALLEEALRSVGEGHGAPRARLLSRLCGTPPYADSMDRRDALSREALALATASQDVPALRDALAARLWACLGPDRIEERLAVAAQLLELAERQHDELTMLLAHDGLVGCHLVRGDMPAAERAMTAYDRVARALRQPAFLFVSTFMQGSRAMAQGAFDEATRLFGEARARGRESVPNAHFMYAGMMYPLLYLRGQEDDPELDRIFFGEMMALPYSWEPAVRAALAFAAFLRGNREAARREFEGLAHRGFERLRRDEHWLVTLGTLSSVAVMLDDRARAGTLYDLLLPYPDLILVHDLLRSVGNCVASALGTLATVLQRCDEGIAHFEHGMAKEAAMGNVVGLCESRFGLARLLYRRDRQGDRQRADGLVAEGRATMARLGMRRNWQLAMLEADLAHRASTAARTPRGRGRNPQEVPRKP